MDYEFDPDDYAPHPQLGGLKLSFRALYLVFKLDTTVAQANSLLAAIDAQVIGGSKGMFGEAEGVLYVRVPMDSHAEMDALIELLRADPLIKVAVQDSILAPTETPQANQSVPVLWQWETTPADDNWGIEEIRMPQTWNLNRSVEKFGTTTRIGVLDGGFARHQDIYYDETLVALDTGPETDHGTHVTGTIGAKYDNGDGVDGVDPFAHFLVQSYDNSVGWGIRDFLDQDVAIINLSLGYNWYQGASAVDPALNPVARTTVEQEAEVFKLWQTLRTLRGERLPLIVAAAGNDSNSAPGYGNIDAKWSSPWNYAALTGTAPNVIVVEAVGLAAGGGSTRTWFSNMNGNISAPGLDICSTASKSPPPNPNNPPRPCQFGAVTDGYLLMNGTSMATPHVTGVAGYLLSLDPSLTTDELKQLLMENAVPVGGGASNRVDAFASAMAIDELRDNAAILRRLVDFDDGTVDGNLRQSCWSTCEEVLTEDFDGDRGPGDGKIDMSDFRRWRDSFLLATAANGLALDGRDDHPKNDINKDGLVLPHPFENIYPDGDFNGDGQLSRDEQRFVPGYMFSRVTDLEVLQALFDDPDYRASQLPGLINSVDIHVDPSGCMGPGVVGVTTTILETGDAVGIDGRFDSEPVSHVYTVPHRAAGYSVRVEAVNSNGDLVGVAQNSFAAPLGSDSWYAPTSCGIVTLTPTRGLAVRLEKGESTTQTAQLTSTDLATDWKFTTSVAHVQTSVTEGHLAAGGDTAIQVTITCPDKIGGYGGFLDLLFKDPQGMAINKGVPDWLPVDIVCHNGGVTVDSSILGMRANPGQTVTKTFTLTNSGAPLKYDVTPSDHVAVDPAEGTLDKLGEATITVTATCPQQGGTFIEQIGLSYERVDGKTVTDNKPNSVEVDLTCERLTPFVFIEQIQSNEVDLARPNQHVLLNFHSIVGNGTGTTYVEEDHVAVENTQFAWNGFGSRFSRINNVTGSYDLCPGCADPQTRTRTANSVANWAATISEPHVTLTGDFSQSYTQSRFVSGNSDKVALSTSMDFLLNETADLAASWSCTNSCTVILQGEDGSLVIAETSTGTFDAPVEAGRYILTVSNALPTGENGLSITASATYSFEFTFAD
jgi:hypothetical protein